MASDLSTVPLIALSAETREFIANMLNPTKFLLNENGFRRDWRGLARLLEVNAGFMPVLESKYDPTNCIFEYMFDSIEKKKKNITIKDFRIHMELMDRWDIIDDTQKMFESDAEKYFERQRRAQCQLVPNTVPVSVNPIDEKIEQKILTFDDAYRLSRGLNEAHYDAFLLYAEEDSDFANEIIQKLQIENKLKLCCNQNIIAGLPFEHEAVMKIISERCNRLLVILSPNFLRHPANQFFLSYTQALSIEKQQRKIVPCLYKNCQNMPYQLQYISRVDYTRRRYQDFWKQLFYSLQAPNVIDSNTAPNTEHSIEDSDMIPELTKISSTLPDSDRIRTIQEIDEETSRCSLQSENYIMPNIDDKTLSVDNKKNKRSWRKRIKKLKNGIKLNGKNSMKNDQSDQSQSQLITETIPDLPSLHGLSELSLNLSNNDICEGEKTTKKSSDKKKGSPMIFAKKKIALLA